MSMCTVRSHHGAPTLSVDGEPSFAALYMAKRMPWSPGGVFQLDPDFEAMRDAGFCFFMLEAQATFDTCYDAETATFPQDRFDWLEILSHYGALDPEARFILRVVAEPRGEDSAWIRRHPDECEVLELRAKGIYATPSYASKLWLHDAERFLRALIEYVQDNGLERYILGYLVCGGDSAEWVKVGPMEDWAGDYSSVMQDAFREWLRDKYETVEAMQEAWDDPSVSFDDDLVPTPEEQSATDLFLFKDARRRRRAIDHFQCHSHLVASNINHLCAAVKDACRRQKLAGVFYGYLLEMVWSNGFFGQRLADADVAHAAIARSGHSALKEVLASPDVDFLSSPYSYGFRGIGGEGGFMAPAASVRRAGKLWISEEDTRTHKSGADVLYGQTQNAQETCAVLKRQLANILTNSAGGWWVQWSAGSWADPEVLPVFSRSLAIGRHQLDLPDRSSAAQVAVVVDAENWFYRSTRNSFDIPNWRNRHWGIARIGAPVDFVLLSDLLEGRAREYKLYYMWNTFHLTEDDRDRLSALLRRDGKMALWIYAPGFVGEDGLSVEHCAATTGINLRMTERQWGAHIFLSNFEHPVTQGLPTSTFWGTDMRLGPLFTVRDPNATTLGTVVTSQGRCEPGFVIREEPDWSSAYSAAPGPPPGVLRELARHAGVHIYSDSEDVLHADRNYVALHTVRAEAKVVRLPRSADVWEVYSRRQVGEGCTEFRDSMAAGSTHLYYIGPAPRP